MRGDISDAQPKPWKVASVALGFVMMMLVWVWQAAKYPDRTEFNSVHSEVQELKLKQVEIRADVKSIKESQDRSEKDLRELLTRTPKASTP